MTSPNSEALVEITLGALLDSMEAENRRKNVFGGPFPRAAYRDGLRVHAERVLAAITPLIQRETAQQVLLIVAEELTCQIVGNNFEAAAAIRDKVLSTFPKENPDDAA